MIPEIVRPIVLEMKKRLEINCFQFENKNRLSRILPLQWLIPTYFYFDIVLFTLCLALLLWLVSCVVSYDGYQDFAYWKTGLGLTKVPEDIPVQATRVYLYHNSISQVKVAAFSNLTQCEVLSLASNLITELHGDMWTGLKLMHSLSLDSNRIQEVRSDMFYGLRGLKWLDLRNNEIREIAPATFFRLKSCTRLWLNGNHLTEIRNDMWQLMESLEALYLGQNEIQVLHPNAFSSIVNLKTLYLADNDIMEIRANLWYGLSSLERISLNDNNQVILQPNAFSGLPNVKRLELRNTQIKSFPDQFKPNQNLLLDLTENWLLCDWDLCWLPRGEAAGRITWLDSRPACAVGNWKDHARTCLQLEDN